MGTSQIKGSTEGFQVEYLGLYIVYWGSPMQENYYLPG